jgi:hypothetical protein
VLLLLSDWSPVVVVLSIVTLERPRRSIDGLTVEDDPESEFCVVVLEPVIELVELAVEPLSDGLEVLEAVDDGLVVVEPFVPAVALPLTLPDVPLVEAWLSGMQSWCTGLAECSLACPVDLSASLPAFGCPRLLHSGLVAAVAPLVPDVAPFVPEVADLLDVAPFVPDMEPDLLDPVVLLVLGVDFDAVSPTVALLVVCAKAGVAPITAAAMTLRVKGMRFITFPPVQGKTKTCIFGTGVRRPGCDPRKKPAKADAHVENPPHRRDLRSRGRGGRGPGATFLSPSGAVQRPAPSPDGSGCGGRPPSFPPCA